jgi:hypothetical protein
VAVGLSGCAFVRTGSRFTIHTAARRALDRIGDDRPTAIFVDDLDVVSLTARGS